MSDLMMNTKTQMMMVSISNSSMMWTMLMISSMLMYLNKSTFNYIELFVSRPLQDGLTDSQFSLFFLLESYKKCNDDTRFRFGHIRHPSTPAA